MATQIEYTNAQPQAEPDLGLLNRNPDEDAEQEDIYRGEPSLSLQDRPPHHAQSTSSLPSSSSGWSGLGLRRGALGAVLERAINRWARVTSGSSTSSASSTSSERSRPPRRRWRRPSNATSFDARSESTIRARRKALDESRVLKREFVLFLPTTLIPPALQRLSSGAPQSDQQRILRTASLPLVMTQLDSAIKRSTKLRRPKLIREINDYMQPNSFLVFSQQVIFRDKSKTRESSRALGTQMQTGTEQPQKQQAWWFDVSSPTWSDMREIGKILHLHPLTLEDILHQDPREKVEVFPRLGYYFIVVRALGSEHTRSRALSDVKAKNDITALEGNDLFATNVYIVVFRDGICSFHFEDIADHTERVRNKITLFEKTVRMSSDWIAHGILDSIVDDFFPLLHSIEQEVKGLDDFLFTNGQLMKTPPLKDQQHRSAPGLDLPRKTSHLHVAEDTEKAKADSVGSERTTKPSGGKNNISSLLLSHLRRLSVKFLASDLRCSRKLSHRPRQLSPSSSTLIRMTSTRRLVTSLTRLIGTKSEVVSQIQKRLMNGASIGPKTGLFTYGLATDVGIYFEDIHDHILMMQNSLAYYERILNYSHPTYVSHVRQSLVQAKAIRDKKVTILTVISVSILAMNTVTGIFTLNVGRVPHNTVPNKHGPPHPPGPFNLFGIVSAGLVLLGASIALLSWYWWLQAKRKFARRSQF